MTIGEKFATRDATLWIVLDSSYCPMIGETLVVAERLAHYDRRRLAISRGEHVEPRYQVFFASAIRGGANS